MSSETIWLAFKARPMIINIVGRQDQEAVLNQSCYGLDFTITCQAEQKRKWANWDRTGRPDIYNGMTDGWSFHNLGSDWGAEK